MFPFSNNQKLNALWRSASVCSLLFAMVLAASGCNTLKTPFSKLRSKPSIAEAMPNPQTVYTRIHRGVPGDKTETEDRVQARLGAPTAVANFVESALPDREPNRQHHVSPESGPPPWGRDSASGLQAQAIDLGTALHLAGVDNPTINIAREQAQEALANQLAARSMLLPTVNLGGNFRLHRGALQDDPGFLRFPASQSLYLGAGANAIGAGTVAIPGVWAFAHLGDAAYEPLIAQRRVSASQFDSEAVQNSIFLEVSTAYFNLVGAEARLAVLRRAQSEMAELAKITRAFADAGAGAPADANRAIANRELILRQALESAGEVAAASARLARLLSMDPTLALRSPGGFIEPIRFVDESADLEWLLSAAILTRPELGSQTAGIEIAEARVKQERIRPWLPTLGIGFSSGFFGGGSDQVVSRFGPMQNRVDLDIVAIWNVQNLGFGNRARANQSHALVGQAVASHSATLNRIRREVTEAHTAARAASQQIKTAKASVTIAEEGFSLEKDRIKLGQGRPIEALDSLRQLIDARLDLIQAIQAYDIAQAQLLAAVGNRP